MNVSAGMGTFKVDVHTTQNRGFTPEELSQLCCDKIVAVSNGAPDVIKQQAEAFQKQIQTVVCDYMKQAVQSDRTTIYNVLVDAGHRESAEVIRRI